MRAGSLAATLLAVVSFAQCVAASPGVLRDDFRSGVAAWSGGPYWSVTAGGNGGPRYGGDLSGDRFSWHRTWRLETSWSCEVAADLDTLRGDGGETGAVSIALSGGSGEPAPELLVTVSRHRFGATLVEVQYAQDDWHRVLSSGWLPCKDSSYRLSIKRMPGDVTLRVTLRGDRGLAYSSSTAALPVGLLDGLGRVGLRVLHARAWFRNIIVRTPAVSDTYYRTIARSAVGDLLRHFWVGDAAGGHVACTWNGYSSPGLADRRGSIWERGTLLRVIDGLYQITGDASLFRRIEADWRTMRADYTPTELQTAGTSVNPACDDCGWNALTHLLVYRATHDPVALANARGLVDSAFHRWQDDQLGGGMWYSNDRRAKSLYQVGILLAALEVADLTGDRSFRDRAMTCYEWLERKLLRRDGLYWCDLDAHGPIGGDRPDDIREAGSVTFLAGNMGMGVLHARLYRATHEDRYRLRALRTADAVLAKLTDGKGVLLDERDAWANGTFAGEWAREVLTLPGISSAHRRLLRNTARAIYVRDRTPDGYYGGCWNGPADEPASIWSTGGSRPQQIMTSTNAVNVIVGAAALSVDR